MFASSRDAQASLRGFYQSYFVADWEHVRIQILTTPYLRLTGQPLQGRAMGYVRNTSGTVPESALPPHLNGRYGLSGCTGTDPLYPNDPRQSTGTPMTSPSDPTTFLVAIKNDASAPGGWYIDSAYPE